MPLLSELFDDVFVINLRESDDRWRHAEAVLSSIGVARPTRVDAVDGRSLGEEGLKRLQDGGTIAKDISGFRARRRLPEIGCAASHVAALREVVERRLPRALIFEDDVDLPCAPAEWTARMKRAVEGLPESWQLWYLYRDLDVEHRVRRLSESTVIPWNPKGTSAYAVTLAGAELLLGAVLPVGVPIDRAFVGAIRSSNIEVYASSPALFSAGALPSVINRRTAPGGNMRAGSHLHPEYQSRWRAAWSGNPPPHSWGLRLQVGVSRARSRLRRRLRRWLHARRGG